MRNKAKWLVFGERSQYERLTILRKKWHWLQQPMVNPAMDDQMMAQLAMQEMQPQPLEQPAIPGVPMGPR
jgi:hypothetical protein